MYDEQRILQQLRRGDQTVFAQLMERYEARIYRLALRYAETPQDAEDLTQEVFVAVYQAIPSFRGASSLGTWIYRIALNHCLQYARKRRPENLPLHDRLQIPDTARTADPLEAASLQCLAGDVERALDQLDPLHRDVVILHELHGLTYGECAAVLGIPVGTVKSRLSNAFARLRELLKDLPGKETL
ncbi:MAG: RNA polymerase sigma factor [Chthonomonadales bacterium]